MKTVKLVYNKIKISGIEIARNHKGKPIDYFESIYLPFDIQYKNSDTPKEISLYEAFDAIFDFFNMLPVYDLYEYVGRLKKKTDHVLYQDTIFYPIEDFIHIVSGFEKGKLICINPYMDGNKVSFYLPNDENENRLYSVLVSYDMIKKR